MKTCSQPVLGFVLLLALSVFLNGCGKPSVRGPALNVEAELTNVHSAPLVASSQTVRYDARQGSKVRIEGTSTMHDWQVEGTLIGGFIETGPGFPTEPGQTVPLGKVQARANAMIPVRSLKSLQKDGKPYSDAMDEIMWDKLKVMEQPRIYFYLSELSITGLPQTKEGPYACEAKGTLVAAGVTNSVTFPATVLPGAERSLKVTGSLATKMTAFGITPPAPKLLPIKTGDDVKLFFEWMLAVKPPAQPAINSPEKK
jgi:hypothetical protein